MELVGDLRTGTFFEVLKRFIAKKGCLIKIYSNNGANFIGANNELKKVICSIFTNKEEIDYLANKAIK